jgi:hypothetical protein
MDEYCNNSSDLNSSLVHSLITNHTVLAVTLKLVFRRCRWGAGYPDRFLMVHISHSTQMVR